MNTRALKIGKLYRITNDDMWFFSEPSHTSAGTYFCCDTLVMPIRKIVKDPNDYIKDPNDYDFGWVWIAWLVGDTVAHRMTPIDKNGNLLVEDNRAQRAPIYCFEEV